MPWQLDAPLSREVVLAGTRRGEVVLAGGLTSSGSSSSSVLALDTTSGRLTPAGSLRLPTHDAAGAFVGGRALVLGGGTVSPSATTQRFAVGSGSVTTGALPGARADASAVVLGGTAYVVGGYDGPAMDREVLATTDGLAFRDVAALALPVRYPAVAVAGRKIYVFGGQAASGAAVDTVQVVDPASHTSSIVGRLPLPIAGAVAANLGGTVYLAGGETGSAAGGFRPVADVLAFRPATATFLPAGSLRVPVGYAGAAVSGGRLWVVGGEVAGGSPTSDVQVLQPNRSFGLAGVSGAGSPFYGYRLLIADRGNNRLLLLDAAGHLLWRYPSRRAPAPAGGFYFPDDAFFIRHGTAIISNQEENDTIVEIAYPSGKVLWSYGHPRTAGSAPGYLHMPDDAYLLRNGDIATADPMNCRVLVISPKGKVLHQIGTTGTCVHDPPVSIGSPNGDTPLANGNLLISEINGSWVSEFTPGGHLVWTVQLPVSYPSDPRQLGPDRYLIADYASPGAFVEFDRAGHVLYRYRPTSGPGRLDHPSLVERLPSGVLMANDDYNDRIVAVDPATGALVWQYGATATAGTAPGLLSSPDGFDLLAPNGTTPTHPVTG